MGVSCQRNERLSHHEIKKKFRYRIKKGDTLYHIAKTCGLSVEEVMAANGLHVTELDVGQVIVLPELNEFPYGLVMPKPATITELDPVAAPETWSPQQYQKLFAPQPKATLQMVSRREWGALPPKSNNTPMGRVKKITLHHTSEYPGMDKLGDREVIRAIAKYHRNRLGWADIGYHFLIGRDGKVYEGRPAALQGAHTGGHNQNNLGISMVGNFVSKLPSERQLFALKSLLATKYREYGLSTRDLYGHRDFKATECPGEALYRWLRVYKANV